MYGIQIHLCPGNNWKLHEIFIDCKSSMNCNVKLSCFKEFVKTYLLKLNLEIQFTFGKYIKEHNAI